MILFKYFCVVQLKALRVFYKKAFVWKLETQLCGNAEQTNCYFNISKSFIRQGIP